MNKRWYVGILIVAAVLVYAGCKQSEKKAEEPVPVAGDPYLGGLVWNNWADQVAGGSGYPAGFDSKMKDFLRCKACHGWDAAGLNGGYVRRTAKDSRPAPLPTADLTTKLGTITKQQVQYARGREFAVLDKRMPAFNQPGGLTDKQVVDVMAFLNQGPKVTDFARLDIAQNPVAYTFTAADPKAGGELYTNRCAACHDVDGKGIDMSLGNYFREDGKYSEGFHKMVYGAGGTSIMTRTASGDLTGRQAADILAYIQANLGSRF